MSASYKTQIDFGGNGKPSFLIEPAHFDDISNAETWDFDWLSLWNATNFDYEGIARISWQSKTYGFIRYSIYPDLEEPMVIEIQQLEASPISRSDSKSRLVAPIGKWLIWYVAQIALTFGKESEEALIVLSAYEAAFTYYQEKIGMTFERWTTIAPGEDGAVFTFNRQQTRHFCLKLEEEFGRPTKVGLTKIISL
ncbi:hypothetical protein [Leptolyngbya sp. GGD]|uniref:hypothetical protein n=1 Tax=Leptolyngbya sp. GGD TaxID=2997907 RepID=UPI00227AFBA5|nr:hypothetical protein [Leptolyngbya sp. GGD]MCY6491899.1 hypothetical protein [Leptolyngbya sp. GGD]